MKFNILHSLIKQIWLYYYNNKTYLARTLIFLRSFRHISAVKPPYYVRFVHRIQPVAFAKQCKSPDLNYLFELLEFLKSFELLQFLKLFELLELLNLLE